MSDAEQVAPAGATMSFAEYCQAGQARAQQLGNRGPMRFDANGRLEQDILDAYCRTGFYVFTGVLDADEVNELRTEFDAVLDNALGNSHACAHDFKASPFSQPSVGQQSRPSYEISPLSIVRFNLANVDLP